MSTSESKEYVLRMAKEQDVKFIRLWFTDILGYSEELRHHRRGAGGGAGGGHGLRRLVDRGLRPHRRERHDRHARPDTFQILPWRPQRAATPWRACSATSYSPTASPTRATRATCSSATSSGPPSMGYTFYVGPELEYFYFKNSREHRAPRPGRLLRPDPARRRHRPAPRDRPDAGGDGHRRRVQPPRGRPQPARDRPALHRRADHGRQRHDLPPGGQGDRPASTASTPPSCPSRSSARTAAACTCTSRCSRASATPSSTPKDKYHLSDDRQAATSPACCTHAPRDHRWSPTSG